MPTNDDAPEGTEVETPAEPVVAPPPAVPYVTMDQFTTMMTQMQENFQQSLQQTAQQIAGSIQQPAAIHEEAEPTDEEIDAAALEGKGVGGAVKRAIKAAQNRLARQNSAEVAEVRNVGLPALAEQGFLLAKQGWKHYDRFKKEVDAGIAQLPMDLRAQPSNLNHVYRMVVGYHEDELSKESAEQAVRSQRENPDSQPAPRGKGNTKVDAVDDDSLFGKENVQNLRLAGKSVEHIAARLGKTPEQYREGVRRYNERTRGAA